jgi:antirestriction protein ArdC
MTKSRDTLKEFVGDVIQAMVHNDKDWTKMFGDAKTLPARNAVTNNRYKGINYLMLGATTHNNKYANNIWATYKQWASVGAQVVKGSKSTTVVHYKPPVYKNKKTGETFQGRPGDIYRDWIMKDFERVKFPMLSAASVFNVAQVDLTNASYKVPTRNTTQYSVDTIDNFVGGVDVKIINKDHDSCYYNESEDLINMTPKEKFINTTDADATQHYYATLFHELTHATKHAKRLNRKAQFQDDAHKSYAYEELVAELGSILLSQHFGQTKTVRENHAKYLNSWIEALKKDFTFLTSAAQKASAAVEFYIKD